MSFIKDKTKVASILSSYSGVVLNVSRLVKIKEITGSKAFSKLRFNNMFDDFRYKKKITNRTII